MGFELLVVSNTPLTGMSDRDAVALQFLTQVGYMGRGEEGVDSVPYRLFMECFMARPDKGWTVEELMTVLETSRPTVYRHLNKLKGLDLLEESTVKDTPEANAKKTYRIRYGNLGKAWNFVEANVKVALENYRKTVDHLHQLCQAAANPATPGATTSTTGKVTP